MSLASFDYFWVALFGLSIGAAELLTRYRDAPFRVIRKGPALGYLALNGLASVGALYTLKVFAVDFGLAADSAALWWTRVLTAGFSAMALFRSSVMVVREGDKDISIGLAKGVAQRVREGGHRLEEQHRSGTCLHRQWQDVASSDKALRFLRWGESLLLALCILSFLYFVYGKFSQMGVLPMRELLWSKRIAALSGVACGALYALIHLIHLKTYPRLRREFTEVSTDIDLYYTGRGFEPIPDWMTELVGSFKRLLEPSFWPGERGIKGHIFAGAAWTLLTGALTWLLP
ncbi:MAG: hypothetical protein ACE5GX_18950 [Thermoanaerobaculia bacterium]